MEGQVVSHQDKITKTKSIKQIKTNSNVDSNDLTNELSVAHRDCNGFMVYKTVMVPSKNTTVMDSSALYILEPSDVKEIAIRQEENIEKSVALKIENKSVIRFD